MNSNFQKLKDNVLVKVSSFNALGVIIMSVTSLVSSKVIALYLGAEGMALIGNLRNVLTTIQSISTLGLYNGVVRYISEYKKNKKEMAAMLSTAYYTCLLVTIVLSVFLYIGSDFWNALIFTDRYDFRYIFEAMAIALPFYAANTFCLAIINGFSKYKVYIILNIIGSISGLFVTIFLVLQFNLDGAFIAIIVNPVISFFITIILVLNQQNFIKFLKVKRISLKYLKSLSTYAVMALISATILPAILIRIRNFIILNEGANEAGYWEAMQRISGQYMMFITTLLTVYLLPKFSEIKRSNDFKKEVFGFYKIILPVFFIGFLLIYLLRNLIIALLFSEDFKGMESLFSWQLSGDFVKIASLVIAYQLLAKKMFWYYLITEIISFVILYYSSMYLIAEFGFKGASMAHFYNYVCYFIVLLILFRKSLFGPDRSI
ncbi:O-antigen translocase [Aquimarina addita]|uniref:O-antigen translocase n=1 Tax=Aquimarina addita TaxID=870485 RepID=A0ABP7X9W9_9FLAO